jgi:hypothetical protein
MGLISQEPADPAKGKVHGHQWLSGSTWFGTADEQEAIATIRRSTELEVQ